jgi:hypothetical protein
VAWSFVSVAGDGARAKALDTEDPRERLHVDVVPGRCSAEQGKRLVRRQLVDAQELANGRGLFGPLSEVVSEIDFTTAIALSYLQSNEADRVCDSFNGETGLSQRGLDRWCGTVDRLS